MGKKNEVAVSKEQGVLPYAGTSANMAELVAQEMDGLSMSFERIRIPAGGGLAYEVPSDDPESPDMVKEFEGVILYHHSVHSYYSKKYTGGNEHPECSSLDGHTGVDVETGEIKSCADCPFNKFGSGENNSKACKQRRRIYVLRQGELFPYILTAPTGSLESFSKYILRLLTRGKASNSVVTKFSLRKEQNSGGITYSQVVCTAIRALEPDEQANITTMTESVKRLTKSMSVAVDND